MVNSNMILEVAIDVCIHQWSKIQYVNKAVVKRSLIGSLRWVIGPLLDLSGFHRSYEISRRQWKYWQSNAHEICKCLETSKLQIRGHYLDSVSYVLLHFVTLHLFKNLAPDHADPWSLACLTVFNTGCILNYPTFLNTLRLLFLSVGSKLYNLAYSY